MNLKKIVETCEVPVAKLGIKNKGSFVDIRHYYNEAWNQLVEKVGVHCTEKEYRTTDQGGGVKQVYFHWVAYKNIDNFSRIKFDFVNNCFRVTEDKVLGIFNMTYTMELDYNKVWRNSPFLNSFLPYYIKYFYRQRVFDFLTRYKGELHYIEKIIRKLLNMAVFE